MQGLFARVRGEEAARPKRIYVLFTEVVALKHVIFNRHAERRHWTGAIICSILYLWCIALLSDKNLEHILAEQLIILKKNDEDRPVFLECHLWA